MISTLIAFLNAGCATAYTGLGPNLFLTDKHEIHEEIERFHLEPLTLQNAYTLGGKRYSSGSVLPIVEGVAPPAAKSMVYGRTFEAAGAIAFFLGASAYLLASANGRCVLCAPVLLTSAGAALFIYGTYKIHAAVSEYNGKLMQGFQVKAEF